MEAGIDYTGISIVFFCHDGNGNFLMNKRSENCRDEHNRWDIGGGKLEPFDSVIGTLEKEIKEEYCTEILEYEPLGYRDVHRENNGIKNHWITLDFKVLVDNSKAENGEPHKFDEIGWFRLNNLPSPLHSQLSHFFEKYKDRL
jgi:8-oxo-dGTP pyrophosphatase MutT (NUDIX family)